MGVNIVGIMCPFREAAKYNSDYFDLKEVAKNFGKDVYYFKKIHDEAEHLKVNKPDIIFVLGLSQVIPVHILGIPTIGCIGSHPALLPRNRGRHPIIWAIANGLRKSGITLFWMDEGVDSGDIWGQKEFDIDVSDDALTVYEKVKRLTMEILKENIPDLERGIIKRTEQDHSKANYWRKRTHRDGEIDWRMSSKRIYDLVRALTKPYVGAHTLYKGKEVKIWKVEMPDGTGGYENLEPGKIISVEGLCVKVKTGDGVIKIVEHGFNPLPIEGDYL
jgi:methionyl-tRNA formyltransferase